MQLLERWMRFRAQAHVDLLTPLVADTRHGMTSFIVRRSRTKGMSSRYLLGQSSTRSVEALYHAPRFDFTAIHYTTNAPPSMDRLHRTTSNRTLMSMSSRQPHRTRRRLDRWAAGWRGRSRLAAGAVSVARRQQFLAMDPKPSFTIYRLLRFTQPPAGAQHDITG